MPSGICQRRACLLYTSHILRRNGNRSAVRGLQQVAGSQHQHLGLAAGILAQGQVNCHLVTVEVGVECGLSLIHILRIASLKAIEPAMEKAISEESTS